MLHWKWRTLAILLLFTLLTTSTLALPSHEVDRIDVLIGFHEHIQRQILTDLDIKPHHEFKYIPVVAASVPTTIIPALARNPAIRFVEQDTEFHAQYQTTPWGIERINAPPVHSEFNITGNNVSVAILDTGIDPFHRDLNVVSGVSFVGDDTGWYDVNGHGTHVAGTVAALNNLVDVIGAAPSVDLYAVKVLTNSGAGLGMQIAQGIEWCITNGIDVINMSLGGQAGNTTVELACEQAWEAGIVIIAAAGNYGDAYGYDDTIAYPARYPTVIAVGATNQDNLRAPFSSTGPTLELVAPGVDIVSTTAGGGLASMSGTSMAAPHVSGVAALLLDADPALTNQQVRSIMNSTANSYGSASHYGNGLVDAYAAVDYVVPEPDPPPPPPPPLNITVWTDQSWYLLNDTAYIYAEVTDSSGIPVQGQEVIFQIQTPMGLTLYTWRFTDNQGIAVETFIVEYGAGQYQVEATATAPDGTTVADSCVFHAY